MSLPSETIELQIVHALPGRIHLKIPRLRKDPGYGEGVAGIGEVSQPSHRGAG